MARYLLRGLLEGFFVMKKIVVILCMLLAASGAWAQNHHHHHQQQHHRSERVERGGRHNGHHHGRHNIPDEVECLDEWQELWNGCHVRLLGSRVLVVNRNGDTVVSGDRVFLTANGRYEVKNGGVWSVRERDGGFTTISGMDIFYWSEGFYGIKVGSFWRLYDEDGDMVGNIWGEHLTLYQNNLIRAERNGRYYYYDWEGNERR